MPATILNGHAGADMMRGMGGNDHYIVDNAGDVVDESVAGSGGTDTVHLEPERQPRRRSPLQGDIERVVLIGAADSTLSATGSNNCSSAMPATTHQRLCRRRSDARAGGNDPYIVDNAGDIVDESMRRLGRHRHRACRA